MPYDPLDNSMPEDLASDILPDPEKETPRARSIFNRFRLRRETRDDLQPRLMPPDEEFPATDASGPPALEPARSPWRRTASEDASAPVAPPSSPGTPASRPMPAVEAMFPSQTRDETSITAARPTPAVGLPAPLVVQPSDTAATAPAATWSPPPWTAPPWTAAPIEEPAGEEPFTTPIAEDDAEDEAEPARGWAAFRPIPVPVNPYMVLLAGLATLVTLAYLLVEPSPRWVLLLGATAVAAGLDGTLRATWRVTFAGRDTTPALFMPAIFILAVPPLIEHNVRGLGVIPAGLVAGLLFFAIVTAQVGSARPGASYYPWARTVSTAGAYAAGFAFFSLTYVYDLGLGVSALAAGLVALMLAIEVLREGEIDATETAGYAAAAGTAVGQWRLALHYLPVDGYLAGLTMLLGFLLVTGLLQAYITRSLDRRATIDHAVVAVAGAALVIVARVMGLA